MRRLDGSFWQKRLHHEKVNPSSSDEENAGTAGSRQRRGGEFFEDVMELRGTGFLDSRDGVGDLMLVMLSNSSPTSSSNATGL
ncbi:hypothetical protein PI125_g22465 [Phytophthora idaei]|nr:hypothetical protein PI125_g22465 [Phytophthora idaei]KAG3166579.1 hypothetical protein PI126_g4127 [Phytophthora idaei]